MSNYGILTDISKTGNRILGDQTRRTISRRTAHGLKNSLSTDISDEIAENIAHTVMIITLIGLFSKNRGGLMLSAVLIIALALFYQMGREPSSQFSYS